MAHRFLVVRNLNSYEGILGLDFLSDPRHSIYHDFANYILHIHGSPIRLFDAKHDQPCSALIPVTASGRHQYIGPQAITFVKVQIDPEELNSSTLSNLDYAEFHPQRPAEGAPQILGCVFDAQQLRDGQLLVGVINNTHSGFKIKTGEPLGFLTPANTQPHGELIAAIEQEVQTKQRDTEESSHDITSNPISKDERQWKTRVHPGKDPPRQPATSSTARKDFLEAFQYGDLTLEQRNQVQALMWEYRDCFAMEGDSLGLCTRITHDIKTLTEDPVVSQPYRVPKALEPEVKRIVQKMLDQNLIRKSNSEYSSPVVLVEKPDKSLRFCVNYQKLNAISKKTHFSTPKP